MAQYGETYGRQTDEYGNPIRQTDEYGNPIHLTGGGGGGGTMGDYGTTRGAAYQNQYGATGEAYGGAGIVPGTTDSGVVGGHHRRSGSSSSSSSEDDGYGGRRKKGLKEKIKEKLPGGAVAGHRADDPAYSTGTTTPGSAYGHDYGVEPSHHHEKKEIMDKIKDKLPGGGHRH